MKYGAHAHVGEEVLARAKQIDPACFKSYSGSSRMDAQRAAITKAREQLAREGELERDEIDKKLGKPGAAECMSPAARKFLLDLCIEDMAAIGKPMPEGTMTMCYGQPTPRYSVYEIEQMRKAIQRNPDYGLRGLGFRDFDKHGALTKKAEEMLRTFMLNGTSPAELEKAADEALIRLRERLAMKDIQRERDRQNNAQVQAELTGETPHILAVGLTHELPLDVHTRVALRTRIEDAIKSVIMKFKT